MVKTTKVETVPDTEYFVVKIPAKNLKGIKQLAKATKAMDKLWNKAQKVKK